MLPYKTKFAFRAGQDIRHRLLAEIRMEAFVLDVAVKVQETPFNPVISDVCITAEAKNPVTIATFCKFVNTIMEIAESRGRAA